MKHKISLEDARTFLIVSRLASSSKDKKSLEIVVTYDKGIVYRISQHGELFSETSDLRDAIAQYNSL